MSATRTTSPTARPGLGPALAARLAGPGGCYNVGNALCLATSIALPAMAMAANGVAGSDALAAAALDTLAGNRAAVALTVATGIFFWGGEVARRRTRGSTAGATFSPASAAWSSARR